MQLLFRSYHTEGVLFMGDLDDATPLSHTYIDLLFISLAAAADVTTDGCWSAIPTSVVGVVVVMIVVDTGAAKEASFRLLPLTVVLAVQFKKELSVTSSVGDGIPSGIPARSFDSIAEPSLVFIMNGVMDR